MNKIYKVVWNKARNCYVVASEFAKNHQTGSSRIKAASVAAVMAATMLTIGTGVIYAADDVTDTRVKPIKETISYDNTTDETTQLNDPNLKHVNPNYEHNGHTDKCGELTYNTTLTIGDINKVADALVANDNLLYNQGIQKVTMENGTISLIRNDGKSIPNNITLTGNGGKKGQDTAVTVTVGDKSQTFQTGSVVTANKDTSGKATRLTINGTSYDIKDTTYSAGDNVTIDKNDNNKISVDLSKYAKSDDVAVVYQDNDKNKSLHSTNAGTVGSSSIALGKKATTGMDSVALGDQTKATGQSSTAIGSSSQATAENAVALGAAAKVNVYGGVALGAAAKVNVYGGVALGTSSVADREAGRATSEKGAFAPTQINETAQSTWISTEGAVSVGDTENDITRQITHVAAGSEDTDAVNVAQLKQVNSKADSATETANKGWNLTTAHGETTTVKPGDTVDFSPEDTNLTVTNEGTNVKIGLNQDLHLTSATFGDTTINANGLTIGHGTDGTAGLEFSKNRVSVGGQQIHDVADGKDDMDSVNVRQLEGVKSIANKGWNLTTAHGETTTVKPGDTVDFSPEDTNLTVTNEGTNEGTNVKIGLNQDLHLTSATFGDTTINANGLTIGHGTAGLEFSKNRVSVGGQQIHDVADGKDDMDAVNMRQLKKAADSAKTTVVAGKNIKVNADTKEDGHTEYNVSLDDDITLGGNEPNNFVTVSGTKGTIWAGHSVSAGTVIMDGDSGTITGLTNTTWNGTTDNLSRAATEGQLKQVADAATSNDKRLVQNPNDSDGSYQVKENGDVTLRVEDSNKNGYNVTIKNVASKAELDKVKTDVGNVDGFHDEIKNKDTNGKPTHTSVVDAVNNLDTKVNTIQSDVTKATEEAKKHSSVSTGNGLDLDVKDNNGQKDYKVSLKDDFTLGGKDGHTGSIEFKGSEGNITASGTLTANAVRVGNTSISDTGLQIGNNKTSLTEDALTIGGNTYITDKGIDANQQKISNVADGSISKDSKDAVNGSQLYATNEAIVNNYNNITNLNGRINNLDNRVNKVGAGAAALAALHPLDFDPDAKWDFAAGYGNYRGANAAAVGAYYRPNEDTMFSVGGTFGNGENMVNAGVSFKLGSGSSHVSTSRVAMAKEIKELRGELEAMKSAMLDANAGKKIDTSKLQLFPDVPQNHWAYEYVAQLAGNGMIEGYPDGNFAGDRPMTRYEFAAILYRAMTKGAVLSDKILSEFSHELEYFTVDTIAKDKAGNPTIQRVRTVKENKNK